MKLIISSILDNTYYFFFYQILAVNQPREKWYNNFRHIHYLFDEQRLLKIVLVVRYNNNNMKPKFSIIVKTYECIHYHCRQPSQFYFQFIFHSYQPKIVCTTQISFILIKPSTKFAYHISQLTSILQHNYTHACMYHILW